MLYRPYVQAEARNLFFTSGQLPIIPNESDFPASFHDQAKAVLDNLLKLVEAEGGNKNSFIKITIYLNNLDNFQEFNQIYSDFFAGFSVPARTCIEVSRLPREAQIEAEAIFNIAR